MKIIKNSLYILNAVIIFYILFFMVFILLGSNYKIYIFELKKHNVYNNPILKIKNISINEIDNHISSILNFLFHGKNNLSEYFNKKEINHLIDIKNLIILCSIIFIFFLFIFSSIFFYFIKIKKVNIFYYLKISIKYLNIVIGIFILFLIISLIFCNIFFDIFHKILFKENNLQFNCIYGNIVNILPEVIFFDFLVYALLIIIIIFTALIFYYQLYLKKINNNIKNE